MGARGLDGGVSLQYDSKHTNMEAPVNDTLLVTETLCTYTHVKEADLTLSARLGVTWASMDPAAIQLRFHDDEGNDVKWTLSRDMFVDCLLNDPGPEYGSGDASLKRGLVSFTLRLNGDTHDIDVSFMCNTIAQMLHDSLMIVPRGSEESAVFDAGIDRFLEEVLGE